MDGYPPCKLNLPTHFHLSQPFLVSYQIPQTKEFKTITQHTLICIIGMKMKPWLYLYLFVVYLSTLLQ
jgi:hypothetical protein